MNRAHKWRRLVNSNISFKVLCWCDKKTLFNIFLQHINFIPLNFLKSQALKLMNIFCVIFSFVTQTNNCYIYLHTIKLFNFLYKLLQTIAKAKQCKQKCIFFYIVIRMCMFVTNNSTDLKYTTNIENVFQVYVCRNHNAKLITRIVKLNLDLCHIGSQSNFCFFFYSFINSTETWRLKPIFWWILNCKLKTLKIVS